MHQNNLCCTFFYLLENREKRCMKSYDLQYENEQLKAENSKLRETLNKAYDFMKQFVVDGRNLLERFLESIGLVVEKARSGFRR